ncbi:MAG: DNA polymerase III subunit chi [Zoogloeaceae bacterium]|jgi:DNA polymerase-3 subunit chi|nr:DNA polymerase III subunit chi [Zoogloeaceae bacterium]
MTRVLFYHSAPKDRLETARELVCSMFARGKSVTVFAPDSRRAEWLDRVLWMQPQTSFVPHCAATDPLAAETPVLFAADLAALEAVPSPARLFNLAEELSEEMLARFSRFPALIEAITTDADERGRGRARAKQYKDAGFSPLEYVDLSQGTGA